LELTFIQSSDPVRYAEMLAHTSRTVQAYCDQHCHHYESFIGLKRGYHPWQAAFNRLFMLEEIVERADCDWVIYLDADAYIANLNFDLADYLLDFSDKIAAAAPSGASDCAWDVNSGVMAVNVRDPLARTFVRLWKAEFDSISDEVLAAAEDWYIGMHGDQALLHRVLQANDSILARFGRLDPALINSPDATFIRQQLRGFGLSFADRVDKLAEEVNAALMPSGS
jgi:hypothetical protein